MMYKGPGSMPLDQYYCLLLMYAFLVVREDAKKTETEETIVFFVTFLSLVAFQLGGGGP